MIGLEFGEKVLYKIQPRAKLQKIQPRWDFGIFIGVRRRSNEVMIATKEGILFVRSVKRIPFEKRWSSDCLKWIRWAPWNKYRGAEDADGDVLDGIPEEREGDLYRHPREGTEESVHQVE